MKITLHSISIGEVVDGFTDNDEEGVVGYHGRLNIRPPYQREFVYDDDKKKEVIRSVFKGFPLNVMYWVKNAQGTYELLDGQQRTLSLCLYSVNGFFVDVDGALRGFHNLNEEQRARFLDYRLQVYICEDGTDQEQLDWFGIINIAGVPLTRQEMRNAVYTGPWITDAKRKFSKSTCVARQLGEKYMTGTPIRQDYLETVLRWVSHDNIERYMADHQRDATADREWQYFQEVIGWVERTFTVYRREMKGVPWGDLYNAYHDTYRSATEVEEETARLMMDDDVTNKRGIYDYILSRNESRLSIRSFTDNMKREAYERQKGLCTKCGQHFSLKEMQGDHILPWSKGGRTTADNCQMLCQRCNAIKSDK
ncbi:MAG: DUF262 domain-containing protein [Porphyromonadaceae bacterium]|nr:DUF262 domain-containing protein [Porphyromonadaceae bacterium]